MNTDSAAQRAIAEYRSAHPEVDDLPDEALGRLMAVQQRALGIALIDLGHALVAAFKRDWPWLLVVWLLIFAAALFLAA